MSRLIIAFGVLFLVSACAYVPQQANLEVKPQIAQANIGQGRTVAVKVVDERPTKTLGHRGTAYGKAAEITTEQDLEALVREALYAGLEAKGFKPVAATQAASEKLNAELRHFEYSTSTGFWSGGIHVKGAMKVYTSGKSAYENMYHVENEERVMFVPGSDSNEKMLNDGLNGLVEQVFLDEKLFNALSQ